MGKKERKKDTMGKTQLDEAYLFLMQFNRKPLFQKRTVAKT